MNNNFAVKEISTKLFLLRKGAHDGWSVMSRFAMRCSSILSKFSQQRHHRKVTLQGMRSVSRADAGILYLHFQTVNFVHEITNDPNLAASSAGLFNSSGRNAYSTLASRRLSMDLPDADALDIAYTFKHRSR